MSQSFNAIRKFWYQLKVDPLQLPLWSGYILFLSLGVILTPTWWLAALLWAGLWLCLRRLAKSGRPAWLATRLTPNFYAVRALGGWQGVFQCRPGQDDCRGIIRALVREQAALPAALRPGRYRAITHDTVIRRLQRMPNANILIIKPAYTASMEAVYAAMTGRKCRKCEHSCQYLKTAQTLRTFYFVGFQIDSSTPPEREKFFCRCEY